MVSGLDHCLTSNLQCIVYRNVCVCVWGGGGGGLNALERTNFTRCSIVSSAEPDPETGREAFQAVTYVIVIGVCCLAALMLVVAGVLLYRIFKLRQKSKIPH